MEGPDHKKAVYSVACDRMHTVSIASSEAEAPYHSPCWLHIDQYHIRSSIADEIRGSDDHGVTMRECTSEEERTVANRCDSVTRLTSGTY